MQSRQGSGCSTKTFLLFYWNQLVLSARPPPAIGPHFDHFAQLCPFGPSFGLLGSPILHLRASSAAPFCLSGHPRASLGILGPGHILQGNFSFYCNQLSTFQKENLAPGKSTCPGITFLFQLSTMPRNLRKWGFESKKDSELKKPLFYSRRNQFPGSQKENKRFISNWQ